MTRPAELSQARGVGMKPVCGGCYHSGYLHSKHPNAKRGCYAGLCRCTGWVGEPLRWAPSGVHHRSKRSTSSDDAGTRVLAAKPCPIDGINLDQHERCPGCFMLYGPGHLAFEEQDGQCNLCIAEAKRKADPKGEKVKA